MRIAMVHTRYARGGGVETYIAGLADRLLDAGHEVHFVSRRSAEDSLPPGLRHHAVPRIRWPESLKHLGFALLSRRALRRLERSGPFDVVHGFSSTLEQDIYTDGAGLVDGFAASLAASESNALGKAWKMHAPRRAVARWIEARRFRHPRLQKVLAMSGAVREGIIAHYGLAPERVEVLHPPVDLERFHPKNRDRWRRIPREILGAPTDVPVLLFTGNGFARKGLDVLIEALALLPRGAWILWVAGRDRPQEEAQRLAASLGVTARFLGFSQELPALCAAADAFALPSRFDAFGAAALEAMSAGLPVVVSARAGACEVIKDGRSGLILRDPESRQELSGHLQALIDGDLRRRLGAAARTAAEGLSWDAHLPRVLAAYRDVRRGH